MNTKLLKLYFLCFFTGASIIFLSGCASYKTKMLNVMPVENYATKTEVKGLKIAADSYDTAEKAKSGFDVDVTKGGYVPINLIFENETNSRFLVFKNQITLLGVNGTVFYPVSSQVVADDMENNAIAYGFLGGILSYMSAADANKKMQSDWHEKELPENKMILKGTMASGVVFFKLPKGTNVLNGSSLSIQIEDMDTQEKTEVKINL
ncbi:MAG: hypothetical protein HYS08_09370 [Chlamydiae bacterium]|nr:hypothetical protein [Chlamydiota bacterium]MBI3265670.1 hypothetical protein [Chlamydiota bacterium]